MGGTSPTMLWVGRRYSTLSRAVSHLKTATENLTGHSDVRLAQNLVREKKKELQMWRNKLLEKTRAYEQIQDRLKVLYARKTQAYQAQKRDLAMLTAIVGDEDLLLREEENAHLKLESCREGEKQCFEDLSNAILESHEKERAQSQRMKYYSTVGSVLGAVFGFLGSNLFLRREVRKHDQRQEEMMNEMQVSLHNLEVWRMQNGQLPETSASEGHKVLNTELNSDRNLLAAGVVTLSLGIVMICVSKFISN